jgi:integrase
VALDEVVFTWPDGRLIAPDRVSKWFARHVRRAGLPSVRLHDVRHSYATAALRQATGWHEVKTLSRRLGHASVGMTLDTYSHALPPTTAPKPTPWPGCCSAHEHHPSPYAPSPR